MSSQQQLASIMAPANQEWWWYINLTAAQVGQYLTQNKAMLTSINGYVATDNTVRFAVVMEPADQTWWWYEGVTAAQVGQYLTENKAMLTDISAYIDTDHQLKFAVIMTPGTGTGWYYGFTGDQVGQHLTQSNSRLSTISAYIDTDNTVKFAFAMVPANQTWWWYEGVTAAQVGQYLTANKAMLTDISPYVDSDNVLKFAVIMAPANQTSWWYFGTLAFLGQQRTNNNARFVTLSPYMWSTSDSITINDTFGISGLDGGMTLTIQKSGAYSFSGGWTPSNIVTGGVSQDVSYAIAIRDTVRGNLFVFNTSGTVPIEGSYNFNNNGTNASLAEAWQFLSVGYTWHSEDEASLDIVKTIEDVYGWYQQNKQTINDVITVVGSVAAAL